MTNETELRFDFTITNCETNEIIQHDWTLFCGSNIDLYGAVETIDIHTGSALRALRRRISREAAYYTTEGGERDERLRTTD